MAEKSNLTNAYKTIYRAIHRNRKLLLSLSAIVVFITSYLLILPAITLEQDEAQQQGGIDVPAREMVFEGDGYSISATADQTADLPEGTEVTAQEVAPNSEDYDAWCDEALKVLRESPGGSENIADLSSASFYDISLVSEGQVVEPAAPVNVKISYDKALRMQSGDLRVIHFAVDKRGNLMPEILDTDDVEINASGSARKGTLRVSDVSFDAAGFSMYGVVETSVYEKTIMTADGKTYKVTVTAGADAQIPQDAELEVSELTESDAAYQAYADETADAIGAVPGDLGYVKFLDISIVYDGQMIQPLAPVDVQIQMLDRESEGDVQVVHFGEKREVLDASTEGDTVSFQTEGFSIYAITEGDQGDNARIGYRFWYNDGSQNVLLSTQYFRYKDVHPASGDALSINEPSIPDIDQATWSRIFKGWSKTSFEDSDENLVTVETLNNELSEKAQNDYEEGTYIDLYANLKNVYYVTYVDINPNNVLATDIIPKAETGDTTFTVKGEDLRPTIDSDTELQGWYDIDHPETVYVPGQQNVVVDSNITLYPKVEGGAWLIFNDNDMVDDGTGHMVSGGASFTPPAFYLNSETEEPPAPTWAGYEFGGWYTDPECTTPFEFGGTISHDTTVYAKWTPSNTQYRVVYWKQRTTDDINASDDEKTYDYAGSRLVDTVVTGQVVNLEARDTRVYGAGGSSGESDQDYFTYNANNTDQSIVVKADGSSVLNVYYDRQIITINFTGNLYHYEETTDTTGELYGIVSGERVRVYPDGNGGYETRTTTTRTETVTHHYNGTRYNTTTSNNTTPQQYGVYNGQVVPLYYHEPWIGSNHWSRKQDHSLWDDQQYNDTRYVENNNGSYGFVDGSMIRLSASGDYTTTETITETVTTPYTGDVYKRVTQNGLTLKGLYGRSMYPGEWPTSTYGNTEYWWQYANNSGGNTMLNAPWNSYTIASTASTAQIQSRTWNLTRGNTPSTGQKIYYYGEDVNGDYSILLADTSRSTSSTLNIGRGKFFGYTTYGWRIGSTPIGSGTGWHALNDSDGQINANTNTTGDIYIYYSRHKYDLTFYTNNGNNQVDVISNVPYEKSLVEYANHSQGQKAGYYFAGWYADPSCTEPFDFNQTMPDNNVAVYGKWKMRRVRVVIEPGANNVYMGSQATAFRLDYDERIDGGLLETATRAGYILDGWYTDPEFTNRFLFSDPVNDETTDVAWDYQTSNRWAAERAAYGDDTENYENVRGILHLYAKWIPDLNSRGINVVYDPGDAAIYDSIGTLLTTVPIDPHMYDFDGTSVAREAPSNYSDLYTFKYWEATTEDGETVHFYPGDPVDLAVLTATETVTDDITGEVLRKTVTLRAVYDLTGDPNRQTTITYDGDAFTENLYNGGTREVQGRAADGTDRKTVTLDKEVNQNIELPTANDFYLDGYELVGWSFTEGTYEEQVAAATEDAPNFRPGQQVAADNLIISDLNDTRNTLYAMWQPKKYTITVKQVVEPGVPQNTFEYKYKTGPERSLPSNEERRSLTGNTSFTLEDFGYYDLVGDVIQIEPPVIPAEASYDVRVNAIVTKDDGTTEVLPLTELGNYPVLGDVVITYTYSQKVLLKLQKRDATNHSQALTGAKFDITPVEFNPTTNRWEDAGEKITITVDTATYQRYLQEGTYRITETEAPSDHALIGTDLYLTIDKENAWRLFNSSGGTIAESTAVLNNAGDTLIVYDNPIHTVTLSKTVENEGTESFRFRVTVSDSSNAGLRNYVIGTWNGQDLTTNNIGELNISLKHGDVVQLKIPHGCKLKVAETETALYKAQYSWNNGAPVESYVFGQEPVEITADGSLAFANLLKAVPVTLEKVGVDNTVIDPEEVPLAGAVFTVYTSATGTSDTDIAKDVDGRQLKNLSSGTNGVFFDGKLQVGTYYLEETTVPAGYYPPQGRVKLTVSTTTDPKIEATWITGDDSGTQGTVTGTLQDGYTVTVRNICGVELPSSGGPGTIWIYLLGTFLLLGCGITLAARRRI